MHTKDPAHRILLVEDEALVARSEKPILQNHGYDVVVAHSGEQAVEMAAADPSVTLVLMDIDLGSGISGTEAAERILQSREIPVVFLTSHSDAAFVEQAKRITNYGYVLKDSGEFVLMRSIEVAYQLFESCQEVKTKQEQLELALDAENHGLWDWNLDTDEVYYSPKYCQILGYASGELTESYTTWERLLHPDDREAAVATVNETVNAGQPFTVEFRLQSKSGAWKWIRSKGKPSQVDSRGVAHRMVGTNEDITGRTPVEAKLHAEESQYRLLAEYSNDLIYQWDIVSERFRYVSPSVKRLTGYTPEEFVLLSPSEILTEESFALHQRTLHAELEQGETQGAHERDFVHKDGSIVSMEMYSSFLRDERGMPVHVIGVARDISDRKRTEAQLERERFLLRNIVESIPDFVFVKDSEGRFITANSVSLRVLGAGTVEEIEGKTDFDFFPHELAEKFRADEQRVIETGVSMTDQEEETLDEEGSPRWVLTTKAPLTDDGGRVVGIVGISHDITSHHEKRVELEDAVETKEYLLKELNHRVKNNLRMVSSLIELKDSALGNEVDLSDIRHQVEAIEKIHASLQQSDRVTHVALRRYIDDVLSTVFRSFSQHGVTVENQILDISMRTKTAVTIGLIVNETATNAIKHGFTDEEAPRFTVRMEEGSQEDNYVLTISNTGKPFPKEVDIENPQTLGLQLISALVSQLHGTMETVRNPHPVFTIRFPKNQT